MKTSLVSNVREELEILKRHLTILKLVAEKEPIGIIKLSELSEYPKHKVRYSLRVLENLDLIRPSSTGAITTKDLKIFFEEIKKEIEKIEKDIVEIKNLL